MDEAAADVAGSDAELEGDGNAVDADGVEEGRMREEEGEREREREREVKEARLLEATARAAVSGGGRRKAGRAGGIDSYTRESPHCDEACDRMLQQLFVRISIHYGSSASR